MITEYYLESVSTCNFKCSERICLVPTISKPIVLVVKTCAGTVHKIPVHKFTTEFKGKPEDDRQAYIQALAVDEYFRSLEVITC